MTSIKMNVVSEGRDLLLTYLQASDSLEAQMSDLEPMGLEPAAGAYQWRDDAAVDLVELLISQMDLSSYKALLDPIPGEPE